MRQRVQSQLFIHIPYMYYYIQIEKLVRYLAKQIGKIVSFFSKFALASNSILW